ncbi:MAG: hypothetical protein EOO09_17430 [Chitinophagaceae bacterium]|nr:MAG: hypothetical protein EOO09_17430 [Chitinophagaceae bacterium]
MNKISFLLSVLLLAGATVIAQSYEGTVEFDKKKQQAFVIDYAYSPEAVENAFVQKIEKLGYSAKTEKGLFNKNKGFVVFRSTVISEIDPVPRDYMVKVEKKSKRDDNASTLYLLVMSDDQNQIPGMKTDEVAKAKLFLNNMLPDIEEAKLEIEIKGNEESVVKSEKKFKELQDEKSDLEKKLRKNAEEIEKQTKAIEVQRVSLDALKGKRRGSATPATTSN